MCDKFNLQRIDLCVLCVFVVRSTPSLGGMYLRIHFTHQTWESQSIAMLLRKAVVRRLFYLFPPLPNS
ncbi:MAG: hypothetical protein EWV49_02010 [Microcystis aeruginosa Ma_QC_Ch_20071001_S25]|uniref:Uncharacterized protein n=1 Tax=Microcystis aeruginosa Ma_QC_Ch_20071001_S25D TaxID=2486250 RepID=A0A552FKU9_MICAE|nr:hypothetical protein [Microcystis aeruginosa]TRU47348.1 MAG: hypothetical protein EWV57_16800 [Microcystis aeruginosa Ma_QC_Ch_20071001_S25D]TRU54187.1 MAG: hypothetical protein EWV49_02010 [Microcystis aeruginosa Ma_QC_Ch_20071001_S25]TRU66914.1 MAG: hypothetical protein EWV90_01485 [Microcystis aeruginosa Ma_QC_Ch_20071001_M135]